MAHAALLIGSLMVAWVLLRVVSIERELRISALRQQIDAEARAAHEEQMRAAEARKLAELRDQEKRREEAGISAPAAAMKAPAEAEISSKPI